LSGLRQNEETRGLTEFEDEKKPQGSDWQALSPADAGLHFGRAADAKR